MRATATLVLALLVACGPAACGGRRNAASGREQSAPLFDDHVLHEVRLRMKPEASFTTLMEHYREDTFYPAEFEWRGQRLQRVGVRSRGSGTRSHNKPGLKIEFDRYTRRQEFLGLASLVLDNMFTDISFMREDLAMKFLARLGLPAPREAYATLYVDDEYVGLYAMVEPIDGHFVRHAPTLVPGGDLFEFRYQDKWLFTEIGTSPDRYKTMFALRSHHRATESALYAPLQAFVQAFNGPQPDAPTIAASLDARLFLRELAGEAFLADWDGLVGEFGMNNFYLYRDPGAGTFHFLPWDKDFAFKADDYPVWPDGLEENQLIARLLAVPELRRYFLDTLLECATLADEGAGQGQAGWLAREVDRAYALVSDAAHRDPRKAQPNADFDDTYDGLRRFARARPEFVRRTVKEMK